MSRKRLHFLLAFFATIAALVVWLQQTQPAPLAVQVTSTSTANIFATSTADVATSTVQTNALVIRAVDGDTIEVQLDNDVNKYKVRLLGVNTPESVDPRRAVECFGHEASHYTASVVNGKRVRLDADPQADEVDKYGRLLRNVILENGTDFNGKLVRYGYAYAYLSFPLNPKRKVQLKQYQAEAQGAGRGLWNTKTCNGKK